MSTCPCPLSTFYPVPSTRWFAIWFFDWFSNMLQSATAVFISAMPMSFRVRSLFSSCFNVLHYILVNVSPDLSRLEAIFCFGRIWTDCSLQSYPLESFTVSWWSKIKKERSKKELKQRSKNETKWQKEQPLQLAGFGSGRQCLPIFSLDWKISHPAHFYWAVLGMGTKKSYWALGGKWEKF